MEFQRWMWICFAWCTVPGYLFSTLTSISWVCWALPRSVTAQQLGSGYVGLGIGAFTLDWNAVSSFLYSPLISPFFAIMNVAFGYALIVWVFMPTAYWGFNVYDANKFPIFSSHLFNSEGQKYDITKIVNKDFEIDLPSYEREGRVHLSMFFALTYGFGFATSASTITHVALFFMVVLRVDDRDHRSIPCALHLHERSDPDALVGSRLCQRPRICLHPPGQHHNRHDEPDAGAEHNHGVCDGPDSPGIDCPAGFLLRFMISVCMCF